VSKVTFDKSIKLRYSGLRVYIRGRYVDVGDRYGWAKYRFRDYREARGFAIAVIIRKFIADHNLDRDIEFLNKLQCISQHLDASEITRVIGELVMLANEEAKRVGNQANSLVGIIFQKLSKFLDSRQNELLQSMQHSDTKAVCKFVRDLLDFLAGKGEWIEGFVDSVFH